MYDFDSVIDRSGTGACKWDRRSDYEKANGLLPMSIADMEFAVAPCVREAAIKAAQHGIYGYTDPSPRFIDAVIGWMDRRHSLKLDRDDITCLTGVVPALRIAVRALSEPGEGVIMQSPIYPPFASSITLNGRRIEDCPLVYRNGAYSMDFEALEKAAEKGDVKLMILCSPHNPIGRVWTREELVRVSDICSRNGVTVVSDEIHADIILKGEQISFLKISPDSVVFTAPSKTFNIPGLNTALALIKSPALREKIRSQAGIDGFENMSYFGHAATIAAYEEGCEWLDEAIEYIAENFRVLKAFFAQKMPNLTVVEQEGTYLTWVDFNSLGLSNEELEHFTRDEAHLFLDEGYIFGRNGSGFERFNIAMPKAELMKALDRLYEAYRARFAK